jgi:Ca-activated chloride channel family protein
MPYSTLRRPQAIVLIVCLVVLTETFSQPSAQQSPQPAARQSAPDPNNKTKTADRSQGADSDEPQNATGDVIKINTELVELDVTVFDRNANPIYTLTKDDFTVYEDKIKQTIEGVSRAEVPISFGLVIDTSGSMRAKLYPVSDAALRLIKQMRPEDEAFLAQFKIESELVKDFTQDQRELEDAIGELYTSGGTALLNAIIASSDYAQEKGRRRRKALIVISDGLEKNSSVKEREVMAAIKENEVQLYMVGFIDESASGGLFSKSPAKKARELLGRLAQDSGGRAFFPKDTSEMPAIAAQIAKDLRTQYVISYYPSNEHRDGTFRRINVSVGHKDNRSMIARTRQGYYARNEKGIHSTPHAFKRH